MQMPDRKFQNANSALLQGIIEIIFFSFNIKIETVTGFYYFEFVF